MDDKPFLTMKEIQEMTTDLRDGQVSEDCPFLHQQDDSHSIPHEECISQDLPNCKSQPMFEIVVRPKLFVLQRNTFKNYI